MANSSYIILGAGPAGLFCAHELQKSGAQPIVLEKADFVGGLAATHQIGGGHFEVGPHIFHTDDQYVMDIARYYLGDDLELKTWKVSQFIEGRLFTFPNAIADMWRQLGTGRMLRFILSFLKYRFQSHNDFKSFVYQKVGKEMAHFNIINYTEKMWGLPLEELEIDWIKPRFDRLSFIKIINTIFKNYSRSFHYPKEGAGMLYDKMADNMTIYLSEYPTKIIHQDQKINEIITNGATFKVNQIISSIPIVSLLDVLSPQAPEEVIAAAQNLKYRSQIYVSLLVQGYQAITDQWIYFPEKKHAFCRVHAPGAFSEQMIPGGHSILVFEYFCFVEDAIWSRSEDDILSDTIIEFNNLNIADPLMVVESRVIKKEYAYPLMSKSRKLSMAVINKYLDQFDNLELIGRHGLYTYDNQHDAARTGIDAALKVIK